MRAVSKRTFSVALALCLCLGLFACSPRQKKHQCEYFDLFDSYARLTVYTQSDKDFENYEKIFHDELQRLHKLLDIYNQYDGTVNLYTLNHLSQNESATVDPTLVDFLCRAIEIHTLTEGYTCLTMGSVTSLWKQAISDNALPSNASLAEAARHTDIAALSIDPDTLTVTRRDGELLIDAGALAKGYAAEQAAEVLAAAGCESFIIDLGGTVLAHGTKPGGEAWRSGIEDTELSFSLDGEVLSTSASKYRGFDFEGRRYHHIISPITLYPENTFLSVSVIHEDGMTADALSTALFSMSLEDGRALMDSIDGARAVWILADGTVVQ